MAPLRPFMRALSKTFERFLPMMMPLDGRRFCCRVCFSFSHNQNEDDTQDDNGQYERLVRSRRNHIVDSEAGEGDCQAPRRPLDQACLQLEPSNINEVKKGLLETRKTGQEMGRRPQHLLTSRRNQLRQQ